MRQTCLDRESRTRRQTSVDSPALLRQLAGMGTALTRFARQVNAGGEADTTAMQIVAALMAIDAGLERFAACRTGRVLMMIVKFHPQGAAAAAGRSIICWVKIASATAPAFCRGSRMKSGSLSTPRLRQKYTSGVLLMRTGFYRPASAKS